MLSTTTQAGVKAGERHYEGTRILSYPFDLSYLVRRAFDRIRPDLIVIVEHELWPNFLRHAEARGIPVAIVNGRLSERSLRGYRWLSKVLSWPPRGIVNFCVEDEGSAEGFSKLGVDASQIHVTGNLKFDNQPSGAALERTQLGFSPDDWIVVAGSTHPGEDEIVLDAFSEASCGAAECPARIGTTPGGAHRRSPAHDRATRPDERALEPLEFRAAKER